MIVNGDYLRTWKGAVVAVFLSHPGERSRGFTSKAVEICVDHRSEESIASLTGLWAAENIYPNI
jgi:hypothetical protein